MVSRKFSIPGLHEQIAAAAELMRSPGNVPVLLVIDASTSMSKHAMAVIQAFAAARAKVAAMDDGRTYHLCVVQFSAEGKLVLPFTPAEVVPEILNYQNSLGTLLYGTTLEAIGVLASALEEVDKPFEDQQITLAVFSDGLDGRSAESDQSDLVMAAHRLLQSHFNVQLQSYGIGIDGTRLANLLGFPRDMAVSVEHSAQGVTDAIQTMTSMTTARPLYAIEGYEKLLEGEVSNPPPVPPPPPSTGLDNTMGTSHFPDDEGPGTFDPMNTLI
jgi:hypothetical protein